MRVIATSNRDLAAEAQAGRFRSDLYYRLDVMSLRLPSLRQRPADILPLAQRAIQACAVAGQPPAGLSADAEAKLLRHSWPGNARELINIVQRAAWLAGGGTIGADAIDAGAPAGRTRLRRTRRRRRPAAGPADPAGAALGRDLRERERALILATLRITAGSRKLAAERLGISPRTLRHKLQQLKAAGVQLPRTHEPQAGAA